MKRAGGVDITGIILSWFVSSVFGRPWVCLSSPRGGTSSIPMNANVTRDVSPTSVVDVVFSDLDGTLIHYPSNPSDLSEQNGKRDILHLPPSSTGMVGIISHRTLSLCRDIRSRGVKLVLVSGMRASTLLKRIPYLPKADAYCCEAGGRIFYPLNDRRQSSLLVQPHVLGNAVDDAESEAFYLIEDMEWRRAIARADAAGVAGYVGNEVYEYDTGKKESVALESRDGALWRHARSLIKQGFVIDSQGYATCFRVNRKQQTNDVNFDSLQSGQILCPSDLSTSSNLGCVDFYPASSGKKNCCDYLAKRFSIGVEIDPLQSRCICLCDDDNDIEMALACLHAYVPHISSDSMLNTILSNPTKFTLTKDDDKNGDTKSTEVALTLVLDRIRDASSAKKTDHR